MDMATASKLRVAVIGAGVTGVLLGQGLKEVRQTMRRLWIKANVLQNGFEVTIYEQAASIADRFREWTFLIHWSLPRLQSVLPKRIADKLPSAYTNRFYAYQQEGERLPFYDGMTGRLLYLAPCTQMRRFSRAKLRQLCMEGLDVQWGKRFREMEMDDTNGPVTIHFEDGDTAVADLVIGADGSNSQVRRYLFGEGGRATPSGWTMCSGTVRYADSNIAQSLHEVHPVCSIAILEDGYLMAACKYLLGNTCAHTNREREVQEVIDPEDPKTFTFHIARWWRASSSEALAGELAVQQLKAQVLPACEPFRSAIDKIPSDCSSFVLSQLQYWRTTPWNSRNSRVLLAGDAAHSMLPSKTGLDSRSVRN